MSIEYGIILIKNMENGKNAAAAGKLNSHTITSFQKIRQAKMDFTVFVNVAEIKRNNILGIIDYSF